MTTTYGLVVRFEMHDAEAADRFDELADRTMVEIKLREPGTLIYVNHQVEGEPSVRVFYELYVDRAAFEAHEQHVHVRHFLKERERYVKRVEVTALHGAEGKGLGEVWAAGDF
ncbi:putative quinol monooxygenase [Streptomyces sp. SYSU K217416]